MDESVFTEALTQAWAAYHRADGETGLTQIATATMERPRHGEAWYVRGLLLEQQGKLGAADRCFHRAAVAGEEPQLPPYRVPWSRFVTLVAEASATLPDALQAVLDEVAVVVADYPPPFEGRSEASECLGCFEGALRSDHQRVAANVEATPRISIYRRAHEHSCASAPELAAQIRMTLIQQFGLYLGYDQDALERLD
jgi:predicted Zn-dependent protease with MMP-like domain